MLVSLMQFQTILGGNCFLTQVALEALFMDIYHVFHVTILLLEHLVTDLALLAIVLVVCMVVSVLLQVLLGLELFPAQFANVDRNRKSRLLRMFVHDVT